MFINFFYRKSFQSIILAIFMLVGVTAWAGEKEVRQKAEGSPASAGHVKRGTPLDKVTHNNEPGGGFWNIAMLVVISYAAISVAIIGGVMEWEFGENYAEQDNLEKYKI